MHVQGICHKMKAVVGETVENANGLLAASVEYHLVLDPFKQDLTTSIGKHIQIEWTGDIYCTSCGASTPKSYSQGHCYKCCITKASCDLCMMKPETCHFDQGTCREPDWAEDFCFQPHIVYLANSSGLKVGITRFNQMPTRWLDQGATQALPIMQVATRQLSGFVEVMFAQQIADKTNWRSMLKGESDSQNLIAIRDELMQTFAAELLELQAKYPNQITPLNESVREFQYPVVDYPTKITSLNLDKQWKISGTLMGIKGQYLILDTGVINLRKYSGYRLIVSTDEPR